MAGVVGLYENDSDISHRFGMQNQAWRQCVYDHRKQIIEHSRTVTFTLEHAHQWRYRLQEFLKAKYNFPTDAVWIVYHINNFQNIDNDGGIMKIYVPEENYLVDLYNAMGSNILYT